MLLGVMGKIVGGLSLVVAVLLLGGVTPVAARTEVRGGSTSSSGLIVATGVAPTPTPARVTAPVPTVQPVATTPRAAVKPAPRVIPAPTPTIAPASTGYVVLNPARQMRVVASATFPARRVVVAPAGNLVETIPLGTIVTVVAYQQQPNGRWYRLADGNSYVQESALVPA